MTRVEPWTCRNCGHLLLFCAFSCVASVLSLWNPLAEEQAWFTAGPGLRRFQQDRFHSAISPGPVDAPVRQSEPWSTSSPTGPTLEAKTSSIPVTTSSPKESVKESVKETTPTTPAIPAIASKPQRVTKIYINAVWGWPVAGLVSDCPVPCEVVRSDAEFRSADVAVWNYRWLTGLQKLQFAARWQSKPPGQRWVANYDFEAVPNGPRGADMTRLVAGVDWVASFQSHSDFWKPIMFMNPRQVPEVKQNFAEGKDKLLLWYVSNCGASSRMNLFKSLASHLPAEKVLMLGACGVKDECHERQNVNCTEDTMRRFKFYVAFENSRCDNYITEKFRRGFKHGMVPIAWGGLSRADYERLAPKDSFIHVDDFKDTKALADYMMKLDTDDASYNRYFEWREHFELIQRPQIESNVTCQLCVEVQKPLHEQRPHRSDWQKHFWGCQG